MGATSQGKLAAVTTEGHSLGSHWAKEAGVCHTRDKVRRVSEESPETREDEIPELRDGHCCDLGLEAAASLPSRDTRGRRACPTSLFYSFPTVLLLPDAP